MTLCPYCEATLETPLACTSCGNVLELAGDVTPFALFGRDPAWGVDRKELKRALLRLSRHVHPDFYATADDEVRQRAERASAALNQAYEVLSDDFARADWLVRAQGGPTDAEERQMPQAFLMQVMEWNETLEEARGAAPGSAEANAALELGVQLAAEREERFAAVADLLAPLPEAGDPALTDARRELNVVRYIDRTRAELESVRLGTALRDRA